MSNCLHCAIMDAISAWTKEYGNTDEGGDPTVDVDDIFIALAGCYGDFVASMAPQHRAEAIKDIRTAIANAIAVRINPNEGLPIIN